MCARCTTPTAPMRCAGSSWPRPSCAAGTSSSKSRRSATRPATSCCRCGRPRGDVCDFLALYGTAAAGRDAAGRPTGYRGRTRHDSTDVMDRYLLARTGELVRGVKESMTALAIADAADQIQDYLDML